ncbi:MAG TPA: flagellar protein export ATPase FliI [bacterium]|jgi:flagellum-specific ATP synthase|nr:flagellar protein export ATPase FliI [bacterium]
MNPLLNDIIPPLDNLKKSLEKTDVTRVNGRVEQIVGLVIESTGPAASVGEACWITPASGTGDPILAEVVGFRQNHVLLMPLGDMRGLGPGSEVVKTGSSFKILVGDQLLGRVIDGMGMPLDGKGPLSSLSQTYPIHRDPPPAMERRRISAPVATGVRAIDSLLTLGEGQRLGIFAGSGVGKSTLLGMIACNTEADVNVIALVGERGREVKDFLERDLGEKGLARSVVIVATSDQPSLIRIQAALVATAVAEYFRDQGKRVMLMMDSITRFAMAQREVGLAIGEPPTTKGYTPSVFALLPKILERAGTTSHQGSITGIYTILVEADDMNEPVADACRSILDGHVVLSRDLAAQNHYPAIDVLNSVSRVMRDIVKPEQLQAAGNIRSMLATYKSVEDLIAIGAYVKGNNPKVDQAVAKLDAIQVFLKQSREESAPWADTMQKLNGFIG